MWPSWWSNRLTPSSLSMTNYACKMQLIFTFQACSKSYFSLEKQNQKQSKMVKILENGTSLLIRECKLKVVVYWCKRKIPMCNFDKVFASFWHLTSKNLHPKKAHVNWHAQCKFWHVVWLVKIQITSQLTRTTKHVTLREQFRRRRKCQLTFLFVFKNITWHFGTEVEHQMKFVKHVCTKY